MDKESLINQLEYVLETLKKSNAKTVVITNEYNDTLSGINIYSETDTTIYGHMTLDLVEEDSNNE